MRLGNSIELEDLLNISATPQSLVFPLLPPLLPPCTLSTALRIHQHPPSRAQGMSIPKLPALRLTAEGECIVEEGVYLDMSSKNRFSVSYASTEGRPNLATGGSKASASGLINGEAQSQDNWENSQKHAPSSMEELPTMSIPFLSERLSMTRTLSMPLPSQLSHLQHPHRLGAANQLQVSSPGHSPHLREVSMELADSIQLAIQTMLQISPPQVLDPAKEQFSACALSVPTSSMSALFTTMKNINYISANMSSFCEQPTASERTSHNEFDVGEMLQCVGDALSGAAAHIGVDLVIYHGDVGLKHVYVSGDESGISFALSHVSISFSPLQIVDFLLNRSFVK